MEIQMTIDQMRMNLWAALGLLYLSGAEAQAASLRFMVRAQPR
jgi:hypothetical protein